MRLGMHVLTKAGNQLFANAGADRETIVGVWRQMGITDVKLLADSDSQVRAAGWLVGQGFSVMVRFYHEPIFTDAVPDDQLKPYRDAGVVDVEGYTNEPEIEWGRPPNPDTIDMLARAHIRFADACGRVGGLKPLTPAIQGDRVSNWFEPFVARVIELGRRDALEGSKIAVHPRPSNNRYDAAPPGFVPRSYELFDDVIVQRLGHSLDIYATEWGYEPGDHANTRLPAIDLNLHAAYNVRLAQRTWRPSLKAAYYWTWLNDWFNSGWWRGDVASSLPVVRAFIEMSKPGVVVTSDEIRSIGQAHPSEINIFPGSALQKAAAEAGAGQTETNEWRQAGRVFQKFQWAIVSCRDMTFDDIQVVPRTDVHKP